MDSSQSPTTTSVLIVDDNPDNLRLLTKILEPQGYIVRKSLSGKTALQSISRNLPDLILLDITMPEMNGFEVCQQLRASDGTATIPIIFISALDCVDDKVRAFEEGAQDYITKPFHEMEVIMRVKNQLLIQHQHQQLIRQNQRLAHEIEERAKAEAEVKRLSLTDELTGLYNRRGFFLLAEQQLKIAQRTQTSFCLLFADLDGLKQINDSFGHEVGDRAIVSAAQILAQTFREADIVARLGGDEFVALILSCTDSSSEFHNRLQNNLDHFNQTCIYPKTHSYRLSISMGVQFCVTAQNISLQQLLTEADALMYEDKETKRSEPKGNLHISK